MSRRNTPPQDSNSGLEIFVPYAGQLEVRAGHKREGEVGLQLREGGSHDDSNDLLARATGTFKLRYSATGSK